MGTDELRRSQGTDLCKSCGLCCSGHLFIWVKLKPAELDPAEKLGLNVYRSDPTQRGFSLPCPLWKGLCTIHATPHYPRACRAYQCKLLKEVLAENTSLSTALQIVDQAKVMNGEVEAMLPVSSMQNFRERLVAQLEHPEISYEPQDAQLEFRLLAEPLLLFYENYFGVKDFVE